MTCTPAPSADPHFAAKLATVTSHAELDTFWAGLARPLTTDQLEALMARREALERGPANRKGKRR